MGQKRTGVEAGVESPVSAHVSSPLLPVIPGLKLPTSPDKDTTKSLMMRSAKTEVKDPMLTQTVSPSKILPPPVSFASSNIHNLLPTQPLLPSEISNMKHPVAKPLNFTSKESKPARPRSKSKKESNRSKMQKLEHKLNVQPILSVIDKKITNNNKIFCSDSEAEKEYLNYLEKEARGEHERII